MKKVIILYGTRYGSTEEVSIKIGETLKELGIKIIVCNLKDIINNKGFNIDDYDGIILGTGIKIGQWTKVAKSFLKIYSEKLKLLKKSLGIFIICGEASDSSKIPELKKKYVENILVKYSLNAQLYDVFGGVIDLSEDSKMGKLSKKMIKMASKEDPTIKLEQKNDFRDWNQIKAFADNYLKILQALD